MRGINACLTSRLRRQNGHEVLHVILISCHFWLEVCHVTLTRFTTPSFSFTHPTCSPLLINALSCDGSPEGMRDSFFPSDLSTDAHALDYRYRCPKGVSCRGKQEQMCVLFGAKMAQEA